MKSFFPFMSAGILPVILFIMSIFFSLTKWNSLANHPQCKVKVCWTQLKENCQRTKLEVPKATQKAQFLGSIRESK